MKKIISLFFGGIIFLFLFTGTLHATVTESLQKEDMLVGNNTSFWPSATDDINKKVNL